MTVPGIPIRGLVWDDLDLQRQDLDILFAITEGLESLPEYRGNDQVIPFRAGLLPTVPIAHRRPVVAMGWLAGSGATPQASYEAYLDTLKARLDPGKGPRILRVTLRDGSTRWIRAAARSLLPGNGIGGEFSTFSIEWMAPDPFWYGPWGVLALDEGLFLDDGLTLDQARTVVVTPTTSPDFFSFDALGTTEMTKVRVEIDGPSLPVGISLRNLSLAGTGGSAGLGFLYGALAAGETLVVDSGLRTVTLNGVQARGDLTLFDSNRHGEYLRLQAGVNEMRILGQPAELRLLFDPAYL